MVERPGDEGDVVAAAPLCEGCGDVEGAGAVDDEVDVSDLLGEFVGGVWQGEALVDCGPGRVTLDGDGDADGLHVADEVVIADVAHQVAAGEVVVVVEAQGAYAAACECEGDVSSYRADTGDENGFVAERVSIGACASFAGCDVVGCRWERGGLEGGSGACERDDDGVVFAVVAGPCQDDEVVSAADFGDGDGLARIEAALEVLSLPAGEGLFDVCEAARRGSDVVAQVEGSAQSRFVAVFGVFGVGGVSGDADQAGACDRGGERGHVSVASEEQDVAEWQFGVVFAVALVEQHVGIQGSVFDVEP